MCQHQRDTLMTLTGHTPQPSEETAHPTMRDNLTMTHRFCTAQRHHERSAYLYVCHSKHRNPVAAGQEHWNKENKALKTEEKKNFTAMTLS